MTPDDLRWNLDKHAKWLRGEKGGERANLTGANLTGADLRDADLRDADLRDADLTEANLTEANLTEANLRGADLRDADLTEANLTEANLTEANLTEANLTEANLTGANLTEANLRGANLTGANLPPFQIPQEGELVVWKATSDGIAKLRVPPEAKRTASLVGRKCRAEYAEVLEVIGGDGQGIHDPTVTYRPGETVRPDKYDNDIRVQCTHGIHFFLTREEAEEW